MSSLSTIANLLKDAEQRLAAHDSPRLDAQVLLAFVMGKDRSYLVAWPEREATAEQARDFQQLIERRGAGEPIAYLTGRKEFWSMELEVTSATLIPRPETELLVELALAKIPAHKAWRIADLGTGSGAIALAIACERPRCEVTAVERDAQALAIAERNRKKMSVHNVTLVAGDWCAPLLESNYDLIVSNPPYVAQEDPHLQQGDVRFEPQQALTAGPDGLQDLRHLIRSVPAQLRPGGWLLLEHGWDQADAVQELLRREGFEEIGNYADAAALPRVCVARKSL